MQKYHKGEALSMLRCSNEITIDEASDWTGIPEQQFVNYEIGEEHPDADTWGKIYKGLRFTCSEIEFLEGIDE
jgi:hypothetical protein